MEERVTKMNELLADEAFVKEVLSKESVEEVKELLAGKDFEVTDEEIEALAKNIALQADNTSKEFSEAELGAIAGGTATGGFAFQQGIDAGISGGSWWKKFLDDHPDFM